MIDITSWHDELCMHIDNNYHMSKVDILKIMLDRFWDCRIAMGSITPRKLGVGQKDLGDHLIGNMEDWEE